MPVGVKMLVHADDFISTAQAVELSIKMLAELPVTLAMFGSEGPFVFVDREDYIFMPAADDKKETGIWLDVNLFRNYYWPGYERGDIRLFVQIGTWLEQHIPGCRVYYTHDGCNEENGRLFDQVSRDKLQRFYEIVSREPWKAVLSQEDKERHDQIWEEI